MGAKNMVIAGDHVNSAVAYTLGTVQISTGIFKSIMVDRGTVDSYELITDEHRKSALSGVSRGLVGGVLLGPVGMIAGAVSAKNKGIYTVAIQFKDGSKSLLEVNDKIYKAIVKNCF